MDTSKEYIKMCEKAGEIQELQPSNAESIGNYYRWGNVAKQFESSFYPKGRYAKEYVFIRASSNIQEHSVWLPRQDQLLEMINIKSLDMLIFDKSDNIFFIRFQRFHRTGNTETWSEYNYNAETVEQCYLILLMDEKYGKKWNGEEWTK